MSNVGSSIGIRKGRKETVYGDIGGEGKSGKIKIDTSLLIRDFNVRVGKKRREVWKVLRPMNRRLEKRLERFCLISKHVKIFKITNSFCKQIFP